MRKNPRKPKTQKVVEEKETSDSETSENSNSDDPKIPENKATEYEKQRELRIAQNKARIEDLGLRNIANSLMNLSQKGGKRKSNLNSKRVPKNGKDDDEYQPIDEDPKDDSSDSSLDSSSEEFEEQEKRKKKKQKKKVNDRKSRSRKQKSPQKQLDTTGLMDEDEALKQAIALSLKDVGETSDMQHAGLSQSPNKQAVNVDEKSYDHSREDNSRRKKRSFKNRVQMTEDDLVINFCQFDETGKGSITLRDLQRMAASHDFIWTDKELADMIRCFDSDKDGKLTLDDFRNIILQCNMLHVLENP
ncbi:serrate RNA effector molecule homolog isoform X3 [Chenopodium quinoa]|uniref:serrate RNA effector molecule homolog isoform X3 n=1 Tax=Chenopodium quinoa TaxID=63459 RepID=UPI000B792E01|nr:serrate RNA effector molecule homolog isoform X3 [Chenopodium quinoa]XP_021756300.1 serrate RNA effector molecule homolog isoform X3 [Chenopodium quinoa]